MNSTMHVDALADFAASMTIDDVPSDVIEHAKLVLLDALGCGLLGSTLAWNVTLAASLAAVEPSGPAQVWGTSNGLGPSTAALLNGSFVHGFEFDDVGSGQHNGSVIAPASLALADVDTVTVSGPAMLAAFVVACEVAARMQDCIGRKPHVELGFHGPSVVGVFAAATSASRALGATRPQMIDSWGHAAQQACGLMATQSGGMGKRMLQGKAAQTGVLSASMAAGGFTNSAHTLTDDYGGYFRAFSGGEGTFDFSLLSAGLGAEWRTPASLIKFWPCRIPIHPTLEALSSLMAQGVEPKDVVRIDVGLDKGSFRAVGFDADSLTPTTAQLSLKYCAAALLAHGELGADQFTPEQVSSPELAAMMSRVRTTHDEGLDKDGFFQRRSNVTLHLSSGKTATAIGVQKGQPDNPVAPEAIEDKFRALCTQSGFGDRTQVLIDMMQDLELERDMKALTAQLRR